MVNPWLPPEVVSDILCGLPVKSLLRFRSVSKTWHSIIHNHEFVKSYKTRPESQISVVQSEDGKVEYAVRCSKTFQAKEKRSLPIESLFEPPCIVIGSVDGMFLFQNGLIHVDTQSTRTTLKLLLWNPSIRSFQMLPHLPLSESGCRITMSVGIGYDPSIEDYKHVRIALHGHLPKMEHVMIYTLRSNSWKKIPLKTKCPTKQTIYSFEDNRERVCFRGILYLIATTQVLRQGNENLLSFDLRTEEFSCADLPKGQPKITKWLLKCASDGSRLGLIGYVANDWTVWWANGEGGDLVWSKHCTFSSFSIKDLSSHMNARDVLNIDLNMKGDEASMVLLLRLEDCVASYNVEADNTAEIVVEEKRTEIGNTHDIACAAPYTESLVLLN